VKRRRLGLLVLALGSIGLLSQCDPTGSHSAKAGAAAEPQRRLVVFAAASLREAFEALGAAFESTRPGTTVAFHFAGSQQLRTQIEHGAEADVFASADPPQLHALEDAGLVAASEVFARNHPVLAVSKQSAPEISSFAELPRARRIVIGAPEVPIGRYTLQLLDRAERSLGSRFRSEFDARVVSRELNVRQVLAKVSLGEADAGIVYRSDLTPANDQVTLIAIPAEFNVVAEYRIAPVRASARTELSRAFIALVLSLSGQSTLKSAGFGTTAERGAP
jgi:molybdate transport system substrate-binding protein